MSGPVAELEASLEGLKSLKPPGVTRSRIQSMTTLCTENVKSESVLVPRIYICFKKTPATHRLGVLYVVDSVARTWMDKAGGAGQKLNSSAPDGTFAAGVKRITEILPAMMTDLINNAPEDQKEKITKLVDIWERGNVFSHSLVADFKQKIAARQWKQPESTTPPGSPLRVASAAGTPIIAQTTQATPTAAPSAQNSTSQLQLLNSLAALGASQPQMSTPQPAASAPAVPPAVTQALPAQQNSQPTSDQTTALAALAPVLSVLPSSVLSDQAQLLPYLQILQQLQQMNVPQSQWADVIQAMHAQKTNATTAQPQQRSRSRSPPRQQQQQQPPPSSSYRARSPLRENTPSLNADLISLGSETKWIAHDPTLLPNKIKVLSRTLFVGGTTCTESELRPLFGQYGEVQTVIAHPEKRHAFVKMCRRQAAVDAREALDDKPANQGKLRSVRWGVGFGPRECNDYTSGVAIIPVDRLTDADRKWVLTAEYGGTGGKPMEPGMCMEEPDIEIGAGVSSKALSDRQGGFGRSSGGSGAQQKRDNFGDRRERNDRGRRNDNVNGFNGAQQQQQQQQQHAYGIPSSSVNSQPLGSAAASSASLAGMFPGLGGQSMGQQPAAYGMPNFSSMPGMQGMQGFNPNAFMAAVAQGSGQFGGQVQAPNGQGQAPGGQGQAGYGYGFGR